MIVLVLDPIPDEVINTDTGQGIPAGGWHAGTHSLAY